jgi:hypothetical protein
MRISACLVTLLFVATIMSGCKKESSPVAPATGEFPESTKFCVTLYSPSQSVAVGGTFEIRVVLYNVSSVFGAAMEIGYPGANVEITQVSGGSTFFPSNSSLTVAKIEPDSNRVSVAIAYQNAGTVLSSSGSGILFRLTCKAKASGTHTFTINGKTLEIRRPDGTLINNFSSLLIENLTIAAR